jgi:hypothetical protein
LKFSFVILLLLFSPALIFAQQAADASSNIDFQNQTRWAKHSYRADSAIVSVINASVPFHSTQDTRINKFLNKYGYIPQRPIQVGAQLELAVIPFRSQMMYGISGEVIVSRQSVASADFSVSAFRRFFETKNFSAFAGLALGGHLDRIVLNGNLPPSFDSLANQYDKVLSLHRKGLIIEPATKLFWYPFQKRNAEFGIFCTAGYDLDLNTRWRLGYYDPNNPTFRKLKTSTGIQSVRGAGWILIPGLSVGF